MNFTVYDKAGKKKPSIPSTTVFAMLPTDKKKISIYDICQRIGN